MIIKCHLCNKEIKKSTNTYCCLCAKYEFGGYFNPFNIVIHEDYRSYQFMIKRNGEKYKMFSHNMKPNKDEDNLFQLHRYNGGPINYKYKLIMESNIYIPLYLDKDIGEQVYSIFNRMINLVVYA